MGLAGSGWSWVSQALSAEWVTPIIRKLAQPAPVQGVPRQSHPVLFWGPWPSGAPGYSRQNPRKSDCSSFRAFRNILPFSVPTTKALSSCTATQATSAFSLESAEHYRGSRVRKPEDGPLSQHTSTPALGVRREFPPPAPGRSHSPNIPSLRICGGNQWMTAPLLPLTQSLAQIRGEHKFTKAGRGQGARTLPYPPP